MKQKSRIISNVQYMIKEKENQEKEKENLLKEIIKLKNVISKLTIKYLNIFIYSTCLE